MHKTKLHMEYSKWCHIFNSTCFVICLSPSLQYSFQLQFGLFFIFDMW